MATHAIEVEETTTFALEEKGKLIKSLRRFDMWFFTVCALVGLDTLGTVAKNGPQGFLWLIVLALVFVALAWTPWRSTLQAAVLISRCPSSQVRLTSAGVR